MGDMHIMAYIIRIYSTVFTPGVNIPSTHIRIFYHDSWAAFNRCFVLRLMIDGAFRPAQPGERRHVEGRCTILYDVICAAVSGCATLEKYITTYIRNVTSKTQAAACDNCHDLLLFVSCSGF